MAVGQNQWYYFGVGAPPILVYFSGGLGCSLGGTIWILTHGHIEKIIADLFKPQKGDPQKRVGASRPKAKMSRIPDASGLGQMDHGHLGKDEPQAGMLPGALKKACGSAFAGGGGNFSFFWVDVFPFLFFGGASKTLVDLVGKGQSPCHK